MGKAMTKSQIADHIAKKGGYHQENRYRNS